MENFLVPPAGWRYAAYPWFARDTAPDLPKLVQVGRVLLPEFFHLVIGTEDAWGYDNGGRPWVDPGRTVLFLDFQVFEDEVDMAHATSVFGDLPEVYERVRKVVGPSKWKRLGIHYIVQYLTEFTEEEGRPDTDPTAYDWGPGTRHRRPEVALEWLERLQTHAAEAYAQARDTPSPKRKRVKLTDEFLREVAEVYRYAENMDLPPTRDVANHFKAPHSTAAKWVAAARRKKFLPPAEAATNEAARAAAKTAASSKEPNEDRRRGIQEYIQQLLDQAADAEEGSKEHAEWMELIATLRKDLKALGGELPG
ncbi:hypothetical protein ACSR0Z_27935 [Streptomyces viridosporus]